MIRWLRDQWDIVWVGIRWPYRRKTARLNVIMWSIALAFVLLALVADFITGRWAWAPMVVLIGAGDTIMLCRSIQGLLWRRSLDKWLAAKASGDPAAPLS